MLPVGPLVMIICEGGADLMNQKAVSTATTVINKIVLKAAARPRPKVSVNRFNTR